MKNVSSLMTLIVIATAVPFAALAQQSNDATSKEEAIARIKAYREAGEAKLRDNKLRREEVSLTGANIKESIKQKWQKMEAYYDGEKLVRLQLYPHKDVSGRTEEFYLMNNELVFAYIQDLGPKHEGRDMGEPGKEFYFDKGKLLKMEDRTKEEAVISEQEKKMYETRLPYEVSELLAILQKK